jgi:Ni,Fe-hydrogenase III component G
MDIENSLKEKFAYLADRIKVQNGQRIWLDVDLQDFDEVFDFCVKTLLFTHLSAITGLDEKQTFGVIYHLSKDGKVILNLKTHLLKDKAIIKSVYDYFPCAENYERELEDLFGMQIKGLPEGRHYPLPEDWPKGEYPMRKDWSEKI